MGSFLLFISTSIVPRAFAFSSGTVRLSIKPCPEFFHCKLITSQAPHVLLDEKLVECLFEAKRSACAMLPSLSLFGCSGGGHFLSELCPDRANSAALCFRTTASCVVSRARAIVLRKIIRAKRRREIFDFCDKFCD